MSEVPLQLVGNNDGRSNHLFPLFEGTLLAILRRTYRGTSLIKKRPPPRTTLVPKAYTM